MVQTSTTAKSCTKDIILDLKSRMQSDIYRALEPDTRTDAEKQYPCPTTLEVLRWNFKVNEWHTLTTESGTPITHSMQITNPNDPTSTFFVNFCRTTNEWTVDCPSHRHHFAQTMILAVMARVTNSPLAQIARGEFN